MKSHFKTFLFILTFLTYLIIFSGCFFRAQINDLNALSSSKSNNSTSPDSTIPTSPPNSTPATPSGMLVTLSAPAYGRINSSIAYTINLSEAPSSDVTIGYEAVADSALSPQNFMATTGTVTILAGNTSGTFYINSTNKSDSVGTFKNFIIRLTSTTHGTITSGDQITAVGMHQLSNIVNFVSAVSEVLCAVDSSGYAWCWGIYNNSKSASKPEALNFLTSKVSIGYNHKCAITLSGGVKCWGANFAGNLGDGTNTDSTSTPVDVAGLSSGVIDIKSGLNHTCALLNTGGVKCWGYNANGQLGNNSTTNANSPVDVNGLTSGVSKIYTGGNYSCALLTATSGIKCWGQNTSGQLGDTTLVNKSIPTDVFGLTTGVMDMALSIDSTCAITSTNTLKCWGSNTNGQLGDGTKVSKSSPTNVTGLASLVTKVSIFRTHTCALLSSGSVYCWGANTFGELGDGTFTSSLSPIIATNLGSSANIIDIQLNLNTTCILKIDNRVYCIGNNTYGNLGDGDITWAQKFPKKVINSGSNILYATKGENHTCYINSSNGVECWGHNYYGQVGDSTSVHKAVPTAVSGLSSGVIAISAGRYHTCALLNTGSVKCWGDNSRGQLGDNTYTNRSSPVDVLSLANVSSISSGRYHTCALLNDSSVKCWGNNSFGQLGDNTTTTRQTPVSVLSLGLPVTQIAAGFNHTCAIMSDTSLKCWGNNDEGELGDGTTTRRNLPVTVTGLSGVTKVSGSEFSTCAIVSQAVKCWGANYSGELGDQTWNQSSVPVNVIGAESNIVDIMASGDDYTDYVCALTTAGGLKCWGDNSYYQAGYEDINLSVANYAHNVINMTAGVSKLVQGKGAQNCIISIDGDLKCFGKNGDYNVSGAVIYTSPQSVLVAHEDL